MRILILAALCALTTAPTQAATLSTILSDTADIIRYAPSSIPDAKLIEGSRKDARFTTGNASYKFGLHLVQAPESAANGASLYRAAAMMADPAGRLFYRRFEITVGGEPRRVLKVNLAGDIDLAQMHFSAFTGLLDRMVVVEDAANGVVLGFPLGVGGVDEAVMGSNYRLVTPKFRNASLNRATVIPARDEPSYYRNRPFMPITNSGGTRTAIAFHITILGDGEAEQYGLNYLVRGFESHGCMRMREKDLMEFFTIVMNGADAKIPVNVDNRIPQRNQAGVRDPQLGPSGEGHVYPVNTSSYIRVTRFPEAPFYRRDEVEHLVIMDRTEGQPDMRRLGAAFTPAADFGTPDSAESDLDLMMNGGFEAP